MKRPSRIRRAYSAAMYQLQAHGSPMQRAIVGAFTELFGSAQYPAADSNRLLSDWFAGKLAPDDELRWSMDKLRRRARDLEKNNALIRNYLRLLAMNVVGPTGFHLEAQVLNNSGKTNELFNTRIEEAWDEWCDDMTISGKQDFNMFSRQGLKGVARDGETFVRMWRGFPGNRFGFALELVDPNLVDEYFNRVPPGNPYGDTLAGSGGAGQNEIRMGVEVDRNQRPVAYHAWNRMPSMTVSSVDRRRERIPADQIIHLYDPDLPNQTRGPTWFASVMVPARHLDGYTEAEVVAARMGASKMGFLSRKIDSGAGALPLPEDGSAPNIEFNPGTMLVLPDGYELATFDPHHPSSSFGVFLKDVTRRIAVGLGVAYNPLASDLEGVNYSSLRHGMATERDTWRMLQQWWMSRFVKRVYREWLNSALLTGALQLDSRDFRKFTAARWTPRGWPAVDPLKETQANVLGMQSGMTSRTLALAEQGLDVDDVFEDLKNEKTMADEAGLDVGGPLKVAPPKEATPPGSPEGNSISDLLARADNELRLEELEEEVASLKSRMNRNGASHDDAPARRF